MTKAAALACAGKPTLALALLEQVEGTSRWLEPRLLFQWIRSIALMLIGAKEAWQEVVAAYEATSSSRGYDAFVFANRLHPEILAILAQDEERHEQLAAVLARANDHKRALGEGIRIAREAVDEPPLTRREQDVYSLLAEGRSNREIARSLFISEPTVKVHVRNILRKLGARTRVEAAVKAAKTRRPLERVAEDQAPRQPGSDPRA